MLSKLQYFKLKQKALIDPQTSLKPKTALVVEVSHIKNPLVSKRRFSEEKNTDEEVSLSKSCLLGTAPNSDILLSDLRSAMKSEFAK